MNIIENKEEGRQKELNRLFDNEKLKKSMERKLCEEI